MQLASRFFNLKSTGGTLIMTLVFVSMFVVIFTSLAGLVSRTYRESVRQARDETAFQAAEAGLDYGRWRLAHDIDFLDDETRDVNDPFGGKLGEFTISIDPPVEGGTTVAITSVGHTEGSADRSITLKARYGRPSLARFASITNEDVWYGGPIQGPVHANGGIRMDGNSDSLMSSAKETYACQPYHGCNSPFQTKPGIWGTGTTQELWEFPAPPIDYNSLTVDLLSMKSAAQAAGSYFGPIPNPGYQIVFNPNNTYSISRVTSLGSKVWSWTSATDWQFISHDVGSTVLLSTNPVPVGGVIYVEDNVWIKGDIRDRVTVAAGFFPDVPAKNVDIILNGDISYGGVKDGTRSFGAIAQRHILIPWSGAEDLLALDGAFIAQKGAFHRRYYPNCCGAQAHHIKTSLTRYGMIASNAVPATAWVDGSGTVISGYLSGTSEYDPNMLYDPPPYFPSSSEYDFISWEEVQ